MLPAETESALRERIDALTAPTVGELLDEMLSFYREQRVHGPVVSEDGDMLLYQWGTHDWGTGEQFDIDVTRQYILAGEDEPYQLHLTAKFAPSEANRVLGNGYEWCPSPVHLEGLESFIRQSAPYRACADLVPSTVELFYEQC